MSYCSRKERSEKGSEEKEINPLDQDCESHSEGFE